MNSHRLEKVWRGDGSIGVDNRAMLMRFGGILIIVASAVLIYVAIDGLLQAAEMARTLAGLAAAKAERFDAKYWDGTGDFRQYSC